MNSSPIWPVFRFILCLWILSLALLSRAQDFKFWLAYGDDTFASWNNRQPGQEMAPCSNVGTLPEITVWLMVTNLSGADKAYGVGGTFLGFDMAVINAANYTDYNAFLAAQTNQCLSPAMLTPVEWSQNLPGRTNSGEDIVVNVIPLGALRYSGSAGTGTSLRPIGYWQAFGFGTGLNIYFAPGATNRLAIFKFILNPLKIALAGPCWGDSETESGLVLFGIQEASTRYNYIGSTTGTGGLRAPIKYGLRLDNSNYAVDDSFNVSEDTPLVVSGPGLKSNDIDATTFSPVLYRAPNHGSVILRPDGGFTYTPQPNYYGADTFEYYLADGLKSSNIATVTLQIAPVLDDLVVTAPGPQTVPELSPIAFKVTAANVDFPGQPVVYQLEGAPEGAKIGLLNGQFTWTPTEAQGPKAHTFDVVCTGTWTPEQVTRKTIQITVNELNQPPYFGTLEPMYVAKETVLSKAFKAKDDDLPAQPLTYGSNGTLPSGLLIGQDGMIYWRPSAETPTGAYNVTVTATDPSGLTAMGTLTIHVIDQPQISGQVIFNDFAATKPTTVTLDIRKAESGEHVETVDLTLDGEGHFNAMLPGAGIWDLSVKQGTWLRRTVQVDARLGSPEPETWNLINGDCNGDNYIGTDDYLILNRSFGLRVGDPGFDPRADLDKDGLVGTDDYLILNKSFDLEGDL